MARLPMAALLAVHAAYAATCGQGTIEQYGTCVIDCDYVTPPSPPPPSPPPPGPPPPSPPPPIPPPPPGPPPNPPVTPPIKIVLEHVDAHGWKWIYDNTDLTRNDVPELADWHGFLPDKDWTIMIRQYEGREWCGAWGFQNHEAFAYAIAREGVGWLFKWTANDPQYRLTFMYDHTAHCTRTSCDFMLALSYNSSNYNSGVETAPDLPDLSLFIKDYKAWPWKWRQIEVVESDNCAGTGKLCFHRAPALSDPRAVNGYGAVVDATLLGPADGTSLMTSDFDMWSDEYEQASMAMSGDGNRVVVGNPRVWDRGVMFAYEWNPSTAAWDQLGSYQENSVAGSWPPKKGIGNSAAMNYAGDVWASGFPRTDWYDESNNRIGGAGIYVIYKWDSSTNDWALHGIPVGGTNPMDYDGSTSPRSCGVSLSLNDAGDVFAVGCPDEYPTGSVYVFEYDAGSDTWSMKGDKITLYSSARGVGSDVKLNGAGDKIVVGAWLTAYGGEARVLHWDTSTSQWIDDGGTLNHGFDCAATGFESSERGCDGHAGLGKAVDISDDGNVAVVAKPGGRARRDNESDFSSFSPGYVRVLRWDATHSEWQTQDIELSGEEENYGNTQRFGQNVALSSDGTLLAVSAHTAFVEGTTCGSFQSDSYHQPCGADTGKVYIYEYDGWMWTRSEVINGILDHAWFGIDIGLSKDGSRLAVTGHGEVDNPGWNSLGQRFWAYELSGRLQPSNIPSTHPAGGDPDTVGQNHAHDWAGSSSMTAHFNQRFSGYPTGFIAATATECKSTEFHDLRLANEGVHLDPDTYEWPSQGSLQWNGGSGAASDGMRNQAHGRRLREAGAAADDAERLLLGGFANSTDADVGGPLEDAVVTAVDRMLTTSPGQAASLFLRLEPLLDKALGDPPP